MKIITFYSCPLLILLVFSTFGPSWSQTEVFFEDWNTGTIDAGEWTVFTAPGGEAQLSDLGGGDFAIYTRTTDAMEQHHNAFYSVDSYDRGQNIYCEFLAWGDLSLDGWQNNFPAVSMIGGPWQRAVGGGPMSQNVVQTQEAAFSLWRNQPLRFSQNEWDSGPPLSLLYNTTWDAATSKADAILHRVYLDDSLGARAQWSADGGATWTLEVDSRGTFGGTQTNNLFQ